MHAIKVAGLTKKFGDFTAVDSITFNVQQGTIFGFLGANGAGKSTTIRMLCGILEPTSGKAIVSGYDVMTQSELVKQNIGYMSQKFSLYNDLTVEENLNFFGGVYGLRGAKLDERKKFVLEMANLYGQERALTLSLPGGVKQRLALGCAIIHEPKIVFLDEPTGGVDPIMRRQFWDLINNLSAAGTTILVTTHYLDEAEFCNEIILIDGGKLIAEGTPHELKTNYITNTILEVECSDTTTAMEVLKKLDWVVEMSLFGILLHIQVRGGEQAGARLRSALEEKNIEVRRMEPIMPSLEDVFISLIEKKTGE